MNEAFKVVIKEFEEGGELSAGQVIYLCWDAYVNGQRTRQVVFDEMTGWELERWTLNQKEIERRVLLMAEVEGKIKERAQYLRKLFREAYDAGRGEGCLLLSVDSLEESEQGARERFGRDLRQVARGLWQDVFTIKEFFDGMHDVLETGLRRAFLMGLTKCGITKEDMTDVERNEMRNFIASQYVYIVGFGEWILERTRDKGGTWGAVAGRLRMWEARWIEAFDLGMTYGCRDQKAVWTLGEAEHCASCLKLHGKVKRMSYWHEKGILPQVPGCDYLECHGWACACTLQLTKEPCSKGPLPRLP